VTTFEILSIITPVVGAVWFLSDKLAKMDAKISEINKAVNNAKEGEKTLREYVMETWKRTEKNEKNINKLVDLKIEQ